MTSFSVFAADNINLDNDHHLLSSCQVLKNTPVHINSIACNYFIQGFLAKAQAINTSINNKKSLMKYKPYRTKGRLPHQNSVIIPCPLKNQM